MNIEPQAEGAPRGPLTSEEAGRLTDHIASLADSGLPLAPGLRALAEESSSRAFRSTLLNLAAAVEQGVSLEQAVDEQSDRIPPRLRGLVRAGLRSGDLGMMLNRFTSFASLGADLRRSFWVGLAYPTLAVLIAGALFILVDLLVIGRFEEIFKDFGINLPILTMFLLQVSHLFRAAWPVLLGLLLVVVLGWCGLGLFLSRADRNSLFSRLPLLGSLWRFTSWSQFCHLLAVLLEAKIPLPEALRLTGEGIEDRDLDLACRAMARSVEAGASLSSAMSGGSPTSKLSGSFHPVAQNKPEPAPDVELAGDEPFHLGELLDQEAGRKAIQRSIPPGLPSLLKWAESNAAIAEVLHMAGETFQARSRAEATLTASIVAFLSMSAVVVGVFILVIGLFLPLITLVSRLS